MGRARVPGVRRLARVPRRYIVGKLFDLDTRMLQTAWLAAFGRRLLGPPEIQAHEITRAQWQLILSHMGARPDEIVDVQTRMGRA